MNIETKFNLGDKLWTVIKGRAEERIVECIDIVIYDKGVFPSYRIGEIGFHCSEDIAFKSKEELLKSL